MPGKRHPQVLLAGESTAPCDFYPVVGVLESTPCSIDPNAFNRSRWTAFARLSVAAGKVAGTHTCALGETFDAEIGSQVLRVPAFQLSERVACRLRLSGEERAVLRLPAQLSEQ
jgi:hypothetical protein